MKKLYRFLPLIFYFLISFVLLLLFKENPQRSITLFSFVTLWFLLGTVKKNYSLASLITLLFVYPFNITINLYGLVDPYVNNVLVNYLIPYISVIDLFATILIFSYFFEKKKLNIGKGAFWFLGLLLLSTIFNPTFFGLLEIVRITIYIVCIAYVVANINKDSLKSIFLALSLSVGIQFALSVFQVTKEAMLGLSWLGESQIVSGSIGSSFLNLGGQQILRAYGTFPHPNVLAGFLVVTIFLSLLYFEKEKSKALLILIGLSLINLLFTFSRMHIFIGFLLSSTLLINYFKITKIFSFIFLDRFLSLFTGGDISINERLQLSKASIEMIIKNPNGLGWGMFAKGLEDFAIRTQGGILLLQPVHNIYLLLIVEHGLMFGIAISISLLVAWYNRFKTMKLWLGLAWLSSILLISSFDHYLLTVPQGIFILILSII